MEVLKDAPAISNLNKAISALSSALSALRNGF
jgi:hypothetical protein